MNNKVNVSRLPVRPPGNKWYIFLLQNIPAAAALEMQFENCLLQHELLHRGTAVLSIVEVPICR